MSDINLMIRDLAESRRWTQLHQEQVAAIKKAIAETELGAELERLEELVRTDKQSEIDARAILDQLVLASFDGNKHPHPAITVKELTKLDYDPKQAREWADTNLRSALVLDAKRFEKAILATEAPDFVTVRKEQQVTVASDLSPYVI